MHERRSLGLRDFLLAVASLLAGVSLLSLLVWVAVCVKKSTTADVQELASTFLPTVLLWLAFVLVLVGVSRLLGHGDFLSYSYDVARRRHVWNDTEPLATAP
jgi:flagellar biosynthesis protein FliQ